MNRYFPERSKVITALMGLLWFSQVLSAQVDSQVETVLQKGHTRYVSCVDYSPDGKYVLTGAYDHKIILWNAKNGKQVRTFSMHTDPVRSLFFSADGKKFVSTSDAGQVLVQEVLTGKVLVKLKHERDLLTKARFSPDGSKLLTASDRNNIYLWDAISGEQLGQYEKEYSASIEKQWTNADGSCFLSFVDSKSMQLVNLADSLQAPSYSIDRPYTYVISPGGDKVAVSSYKSTARIFDLKTGKMLHELNPVPENPCNGCKLLLAFSNSGKYLATVTKYSDVVIWNANKGTIVASYPKAEKWIDEVAFSPDEKHVIVTGDGQSQVYNLKSGRRVLQLSYDRLDCLPAFSPDGQYLLTTNKGNTAALWSLASGKQVRQFKGYQNSNRNDGLDFNQADWFHTNIIKHLEKKNTAALSPDGLYIAKGGIDSVAVLFNVATGKIERVFSGHQKAVISCTFSNDGQFLLTGSGDHTIKLWDVKTGALVRTFKGHQGLIFDARFSSDDALIVSGSWDGSLRIWETATGKPLKYVRTENASPYCVGFSPNDLYVVTGDLNEELKLWEADAAKEFRNIIGHTDIVSDICFSPDGRQMVTASHDGTVKVWDFLSGMLVGKMTSHASGVYAVAYHPQGKYIVSGSNDRTIKVWDAASGKEMRTLAGHAAGVTSLQIDKDGKRLVSCSMDGDIKVWDLNSFEELYTYIQIDRNNWLAKTPQGYFDGSPAALKHINYVSGMEVINVGSLFERYYSPNLIRRLMDGETFEAQGMGVKTLMKRIPQITLSIEPDVNKVDVVDADSIVTYRNSIALSVKASDQQGLEELRVYNNGKLVHRSDKNEAGRRLGKQHETVLELPVEAGVNKLSAVAFNSDRTESSPAAVQVFYDGVESDVDLFVFAIGINKYQNPAYELNYAVEDAKAYLKTVEKNADVIFKSVETILLRDDEASKEGIEKVLNSLAAKAGPEDVFVFYFAGHGAMSSGNAAEEAAFYIVPYDVTQLYGNDDELKQKALSTQEILDFSKQIPARKQIFVLDACQAGGALTAFNVRGASREKAVAQLARSTGTYFLLASGAIQYASESRHLKHGLFTYALLEGLAGKADGASPDQKITANELKGYVEDRVPELTRELMLTPQYPTGYSFGQDFPLVIVK